MDNSGNLKNPEREQYIKQFDAGQYLKQLRGERSLVAVCKLLRVTPAHISEIERGKMPSDHLISALSKVYEVEEDELFRRWGKIPISAREEFAKNATLQDTLAEIGRNDDLTDTQRQEIYSEFAKVYRNFLVRVSTTK